MLLQIPVFFSLAVLLVSGDDEHQGWLSEVMPHSDLESADEDGFHSVLDLGVDFLQDDSDDADLSAIEIGAADAVVDEDPQATVDLLPSRSKLAVANPQKSFLEQGHSSHSRAVKARRRKRAGEDGQMEKKALVQLQQQRNLGKGVAANVQGAVTEAFNPNLSKLSKHKRKKVFKVLLLG